MSRSLIAVPLALSLLSAEPLATLATQAAETKAEQTDQKEEIVAKGLKSRLFEVKNRRPHDLSNTFMLLGSGAPGARVMPNDELKTITARDYPENLAQMEDALKRLDVAGPALSDVDLTIHVLEARKGDGTSGDLPADLKGAVSALRGTLAYKGYHLLTTFTLRVKDGTRGIRGGGDATVEGAPDEKRGRMETKFSINQVSIIPAASGPAAIRLDGLRFDATWNGQATIDTGVSLKEGEQVVVGTSVLNDRGLVLVVSARIRK